MEYMLSEMAVICGGDLVGNNRKITSVFTDSRGLSVGEGSLFVAISGRNHEGHSYINELYSRGVHAFIIERDVATDKYADAEFIRVKSSVAALQALAADYRDKFKGKVVAITGSNGKTVVKEWVATLIPPEVKLFRSPKSYNSQIGVPLSVLMIRGDEDVAVIEAGISQPGEMEKLQRIIRPDIGVITTIGDAHQENFDSIEQKIEEKLHLFIDAHSIVYNSSYRGIERALGERFKGVVFVDAASEDEVYQYFKDAASRENAAAAVALCDLLGYAHNETLGRLSQLQPVAMRLELKEGFNGSLIVNDSYNSDINSLAIVFDYLNNVAGGRRQTIVLSDILQSGFTERELYEKVASMVGSSQVDRFVGIGDRIRRYAHLFTMHAEFHPTTESYLASLRMDDIAGRAVLIKGNRGSQFERLSHALERKSHTTVLEVDLDAMINNLNAHRAMLTTGVKLMAMVKASGYGHGNYEVAAMLQNQGVDYLAVAFADEGVLLRERGITMPIVVLNADSDSFDLMITNSLEPEIYSFVSLNSFISKLKRHGERDYPIHIKLDTGMHRLGFEIGDIERLSIQLRTNGDVIRVSSLFSHLASSDEPADDDFTRTQITLFKNMSDRICDSLPYKPLRHIANSAAVERFPEAGFDMVRLGIGLYGVGAVDGLSLIPVATLRTRIVQIKELGMSETVGYGRAGKLSGATKIATIPIGYADGLNRRLGNGQWAVIVGGRAAPLVGRVCMDTCMIDITGLDASEGDSVVIYGTDKGHTVEDMACVLGTIPYEIMTGLSARVKRVYVKE